MLIIGAISISYLHANKSPLKILPLNSRTVAVLPFKNMSDSHEDEYFSDGITEDILTQLSKVSELKVISRTSVMKFKTTKLSIPEIAQELGAGSILEGSVRRAGQKVRITAQLINAGKDEHIWAETFDRELDDIFSLQSEIALKIAAKLEAQLAPKEVSLIESKPTENIEAYAYYLKGREAASEYTDEDNQLSIKFYKKALLIDSAYALAYAGLALSYDQMVRRYFYGEEWRDSAIAMSKLSLSLDPNLAEGHSSLAKSYEANGDYSLAKYHYEEAIRLNPNYYAAIYNLGVVYFNEERLDKSYELIRNSIQLQPDNIFGYIVLAGISQKFGCNNLALNWLNRALELEPENLLTNFYLSEHFLITEEFETSQKFIDKIFNIENDWPFGILQEAKLNMHTGNYLRAKDLFEVYFQKTNSNEKFEYAYVLKKLNNSTLADSILHNQIEQYKSYIDTKPDQSFYEEFHLANISAILGRKNEALNRLERSIRKGFIDYQKILIHPFWDSINVDLRFQKNIKMIKIKIDSMITIIQKKDETWTGCY